MAEMQTAPAGAGAGRRLLTWVDNRFPLTKLYNEHLGQYYAPKNFNIWYVFGSLALLVLVMQILTGILLTMHYKPDAAKAFAALGPALGLDPITTNFLGVLARNGRKREVRSIIRTFKLLAAGHRGETTAEVVSAHPLNDDQIAQLKTQLRARAGGDVTLDARVDPAILGGIVVNLGSQRIDASIRTKLNTLAQAMKG